MQERGLESLRSTGATRKNTWTRGRRIRFWRGKRALSSESSRGRVRGAYEFVLRRFSSSRNARAGTGPGQTYDVEVNRSLVSEDGQRKCSGEDELRTSHRTESRRPLLRSASASACDRNGDQVVISSDRRADDRVRGEGMTRLPPARATQLSPKRSWALCGRGSQSNRDEPVGRTIESGESRRSASTPLADRATAGSTRTLQRAPRSVTFAPRRAAVESFLRTIC